MADGLAQLDAMIARVRSLPDALPRVAQQVARDLHAELTAQIARGQGPDGTAWAERKAGGLALQGAASSLSVRAIGTSIVAAIEGHYARHHRGWVRGGTRRQILPVRTVPDPVVRAIGATLTREVRRTLGVR